MGLEKTATTDSQSPRRLTMDDLKQNPCFRMLQVRSRPYLRSIEGMFWGCILIFMTITNKVFQNLQNEYLICNEVYQDWH